MTDVTLKIDGADVTVPEGTLVIRAAEQAGIEIPRFCDHPLLEPVGACRQCLVDIPDAGNGRGFPKPQASCTIPVAEGMVVETQNRTAVKAQQGIMEFLLVNHPLDCPVCDKGGECPLQNQAMSHGQGETRFDGVKRTFPKPINLSPNVLLDRERCIVCQRCTRFAAEIPGDPGIALIQRGAQQQIGIAEDKPFSSYFSGNVIQICPVGALTSDDYRFRARPFDLVSTPSVAEHDACGAAIRVDHRRGKVMRRLAGNDPEVNEEWISDKDRFGFRYAVRDRLTSPMIREDGELRPASWLEAVAVAAQGLAAAGSVGVLPGGRLTLEDAKAYATFARETLRTPHVDFRSRPLSAEETGFLRSRVAGTSVTYADLDAADHVVLVGLEPEDEAGTLFLRLRKANRAGLRITALSAYASEGSRKLGAEVVLTAPGAEKDALSQVSGVTEASVILVGERLATSPGGYTAAAELADRSGAKLAWVPRRAGDRGAVEADLLPGEGGLDAEAMVRQGGLDALLVAGVDPDDTADPAAFLAALDEAGFVVSLEQRVTAVTERADVVLPVAAASEKAGTFVTWEGRRRPFQKVFEKPATYSDAEVLAHITAEIALLETETAGVADETVESSPTTTFSAATTEDSAGLHLATWHLMLDNGTLQRGDKALAATARAAVVRLPAALHAELGDVVTITGDRGSWTLPALPAEMAEGTVWVPTNSFGRGVWADLASPGSTVTVEGAVQ
ncbi:NADH-quinone oxidoreductase subunit G [Nocardioides luteus]|uniref:NADH-quinone oxidoreductase n=1 Tax=Nocardioides luteus TaxID=1844 RepID=A0ABQ5SS50_9ACTN|nr:NADH-quinone oxidoreductase subunit G [Nocardioides luteus]MDR7313429.1 NADH-quinone oxidoreductase subunit G [Nocardioides luteus]GGR60837.1 NADH-quinone oxidoreductase subunit G [Nocardioides luteus]GLJ66495.1 NADH-quinone oxidoreductase subunit G [Nocardioides luteus]